MTLKRITLALVLVALGINLAIGAKLYSETATKADKENPYAQMELLTQVMEAIRKDYVDSDKVAYTNLAYGALAGMLNKLDPHSQFMEPQAYHDMKDDTEGSFGGLGIVISMSKEGFLTVVAPMEDTPGARAGLLPGDRIIKIDGKSTEKLALPEAVRQLRGDPGTKVTLSIFRSKAKEPSEKIKDYTIERAKIKVDSVKDAKIIEDGIGYLRITQFNQPTEEEFENALQKLEKQGLDALILDLRNNPGGLLESARQIASKFVPSGKLIVSTEGRDPARTERYQSVSGKKRLTVPIVILVNGGSASGSEIVAGALQDLKRAVLVGETTFGKGSVQSILPLKDGSAVRLTTAKYYTPSHKVIHEHGITPDILVPITEEAERKLIEARNRATLPPSDPAEKIEPAVDEQLDRALAVIKGVKLFAKQTKSGRLARETASAR